MSVVASREKWTATIGEGVACSPSDYSRGKIKKMGKDEAIVLFGDYTIAQAITFILAIGFILGILVAIYKISAKIHDITKENKEKMEEYGNKIKEVDETFKDTTTVLESITETISMLIRYSLVEACTQYLEVGEITPSQLKAIMDLYDVYHVVLKKNSYVTSLVQKVEELPISVKDYDKD